MNLHSVSCLGQGRAMRQEIESLRAAGGFTSSDAFPPLGFTPAPMQEPLAFSSEAWDFAIHPVTGFCYLLVYTCIPTQTINFKINASSILD